MRRGLFQRAGLLALTFVLAIAAATTANAAPANITPTVLNTAPVGTPMSEPGRGQLYMCALPSLGGNPPPPVSQVDRPWRNGNVLNVAKIGESAVPGKVKMAHQFKITTTATKRYFKGNGIPPWPVGKYPIPSNSAAYQYYSVAPGIPPYATADLIPIKPYNLHVNVTRKPKANKKPTCIPSLSMGVALDGIMWHAEIAATSLTSWVDPNAALPTDNCFGHPWNTQYHVHGFSWKCLTQKSEPGSKASPLYGYAWDGFGIYGPRDANGKWITNKQLDECHGRTAEVMWEGKLQKIYHYVLNNEYPYSIGCFRGTPAILPHNLQHNMS
jgi:hypothetical protein